MNLTELIMNVPIWFVLGAIVFLGGWATYQLSKSQIVCTLAVFVGSMILGVLAMSGLGILIGTMLN